MSASEERPELQHGDRGEWVTYLQERLEAVGCSPDGIDGEFGENTTSAVRRFQADTGLDETGIVNPETWARLATCST